MRDRDYTVKEYGEQIVPGFAYRFEGEQLISERSAFQQIDVYENASFGRLLALDGLTQTTERDEFIYHEMLVHVPLISLPEPRRVLIIGGGDGGTLRRVLEHPTVERAVMVEIDERVTQLCRELMPSIAGEAFDDPRAEVHFADGIAYVRDGGESFDAILIDSSDPVGPGEGLFTIDFYRAARGRLNDDGVLCAQSGSPGFQQDELHRTYKHATAAFDDVRVYVGFVPTYPGGMWSFTLAGSRLNLDPVVAAARADERKLQTRYWRPELQRGAFDAPQIVHDVVAPDGPPHTWGLSPAEHERG
ncbi:MAG TPA: polyamine aminopropyltransferase [Actinomycetota bacterium]|nr:polyamine aminopropyltransferase [Actinomycetota bacterium]